MKRYKFEKESNNNWYVVLPEWTGAKAELQMVAGADTMLDIMSEGEDFVYLYLSLESFEGCSELIKLRDTPEIGGADYVLHSFRGIEYHLELWLCDVTAFVFGHMPNKIYIA